MCIVLFCAICSATPFLTGAYVQYDLSARGVANIGTLKTKLLQGRYNAVTLPVYHSDLNGLESALGTLRSDVKTILEDRCWNPAPGDGVSAGFVLSRSAIVYFPASIGCYAHPGIIKSYIRA